jgi:hypothetical protein
MVLGSGPGFTQEVTPTCREKKPPLSSLDLYLNLFFLRFTGFRKLDI